MKITLEMLKEKNACSEGILFFTKTWGLDADHLDIFKKLKKIKISYRWMEWLMITFKLSGVAEIWYTNENIREKQIYKNGLRHGIYKMWGLTKKSVVRSGRYKNDTSDGVWKDYYYISGNLESKYRYKYGCLHKCHKIYYKNGNLKVKRYYKNGFYDGKYEEWYENGKRKERSIYTRGLLCGSHKRWDKDGVLIYFDNPIF